jgi:hypothetical protein
MVSNVSLYPFDPADEYVAYELSGERPPPALRRVHPRELHGQIRFEAPCVSIPGPLSRFTRISLEELEFEMERAARSQERS